MASTLFQFANDAHSVLQTGISSSATSLTVGSGSGALFPTANPALAIPTTFYCTILDALTLTTKEIVLVTQKVGDVFTIVRSQQGTTAPSAGWPAGSIVSQLITAGDLQTFVQSVQLPSFGQTTYPLIMNASGSGSSPGTSFNGAAAQTLSYNTLGALAANFWSQSGNCQILNNGFFRFPNGLQIMWGEHYIGDIITVASGTVTYASKGLPNFPNAGLAVFVCPKTYFGSSFNVYVNGNPAGTGSTSFNWYADEWHGTTQSAALMFLVIGY